MRHGRYRRLQRATCQLPLLPATATSHPAAIPLRSRAKLPKKPVSVATGLTNSVRSSCGRATGGAATRRVTVTRTGAASGAARKGATRVAISALSLPPPHRHLLHTMLCTKL